MKTIIERIKLFYNLLRISNNPQDTKAVFKVTDSLLSLGLLKSEKDLLKSTSEGLQFCQSRKLLGKVDLKELQKCPVGSIGKIYADRMIRDNLSPDFFNVLDVTNDEIYFMMRLRQTHDLWHVLTGFDTSIKGELGLQAFMMIQTHTPLAPLVIGAMLIRSALKDQKEAREIMESVLCGWQMAKHAKPIFAIDWEAQWSTPLEDLRNVYNVIALRA